MLLFIIISAEITRELCLFVAYCNFSSRFSDINLITMNRSPRNIAGKIQRLIQRDNISSLTIKLNMRAMVVWEREHFSLFDLCCDFANELDLVDTAAQRFLL